MACSACLAMILSICYMRIWLVLWLSVPPWFNKNKINGISPWLLNPWIDENPNNSVPAQKFSLAAPPGNVSLFYLTTWLLYPTGPNGRHRQPIIYTGSYNFPVWPCWCWPIAWSVFRHERLSIVTIPLSQYTLLTILLSSQPIVQIRDTRFRKFNGTNVLFSWRIAASANSLSYYFNIFFQAKSYVH